MTTPLSHEPVGPEARAYISVLTAQSIVAMTGEAIKEYPSNHPHQLQAAVLQVLVKNAVATYHLLLRQAGVGPEDIEQARLLVTGSVRQAWAAGGADDVMQHAIVKRLCLDEGE